METITFRTNTELLNVYVSENKEILQTDGKNLFCKVCDKSISFETKSLVHRHLKSKKHQQVLPGQSRVRFETGRRILADNQDFCRTCMKQFSKAAKQKDKQYITETPAGYENNTIIMELLEIIQPQIKVELKANLPTLMCSDCIEKLMVSYEFIEMYKNVDKKLQKMLEEFNMNNCSNNLNSDEQHDSVGELGKLDKCKIEIEQINIDGFEKKEVKSDTERPDMDIEKNETVESDPFNSSSDDGWIPKNCFPKNSSKTRNSNETTKKVFKGFLQPETNNDGSLACQLCKSIFDSVLLWRKHIQQFHLEENPTRVSNKRVRTKIEPNDKDLYKCEFCERTFPKCSLYRRHVRLHTQEPLLCIECGKSFKLHSSYNTHMLRHKGDKKYKCPHCPKGFVCASGLYVHVMVHNNNKPFVCDTCGAAFHTSYRLRQHCLHHSGIKKFHCEYCDMRFINRETQQRHTRTHTGEKPYRCKYCERAFSQSNDCVKHLRQHLGDNVYQCDLCPLRFPLVRDLRVHFATHKDDDEETRSRNLKARMEEERKLQIRLSIKTPV